MEKIEIRKAVQQTNSAEIVASIDDLLIEILLHLPIKSLCCFKSVTKHWQSLISNSRFCRLRSRKTNPAIGLFLPRPSLPPGCYIHEYVPFCDTESTRKLKYLIGTNTTEVLQSCNGLLLCHCYSFQERKTMFYVCNPTTNQISVLPELNDEDSLGCRKMSLAFDPAISPHYRIVCVQLFDLHKHVYRIVTYSSETGAWGVHGEPFTIYFRFGGGVYLNGAIHWMARKISTGLGWYFKIDDQVLDTMPRVLHSHALGSKNFYFGESCGHLHYVEIRASMIQFNVYEMRNDYSEWFVKYKVDLSLVVDAYPEMTRSFTSFTNKESCYYCYSVYCIIHGKEEEKEEDESFLVLQIPGKAIRYNLVRKTFENLQNFEVEFDDHDYDKGSLIRYLYTPGYQYIESMSCV